MALGDHFPIRYGPRVPSTKKKKKERRREERGEGEGRGERGEGRGERGEGRGERGEGRGEMGEGRGERGEERAERREEREKREEETKEKCKRENWCWEGGRNEGERVVKGGVYRDGFCESIGSGVDCKGEPEEEPVSEFGDLHVSFYNVSGAAWIIG